MVIGCSWAGYKNVLLTQVTKQWRYTKFQLSTLSSHCWTSPPRVALLELQPLCFMLWEVSQSTVDQNGNSVLRFDALKKETASSACICQRTWGGSDTQPPWIHLTILSSSVQLSSCPHTPELLTHQFSPKAWRNFNSSTPSWATSDVSISLTLPSYFRFTGPILPCQCLIVHHQNTGGNLAIKGQVEMQQAR